jgi:hypothetical protein
MSLQEKPADTHGTNGTRKVLSPIERVESKLTILLVLFGVLVFQAILSTYINWGVLLNERISCTKTFNLPMSDTDCQEVKKLFHDNWMIYRDGDHLVLTHPDGSMRGLRKIYRNDVPQN